MSPGVSYALWVVLYIALLVCSWLATVFGLPGNWAIVALSAGFAALFPAAAGPGISWWTVAALAVIAGLGELLELIAGAAGVSKGGSKRGAVLAILGSFVGSLVGASLGLPVPVVGSIVGVVLGACLGAMGGAIVGELWAGKTGEHSLQIGQAAFWGRLFGTIAKVSLGSAMVAIGAVAAMF